jgi:uncharacterized protein (DUF58 family)
MQRSFLVGFIIYLLHPGGLVTMRGDWLALALPFIVYLLLGLWRAPGELRLEVHRTISVERAIAGTPITVTVAITNLGNTIEELLLEDNLSPPLIFAMAPLVTCLRWHPGGHTPSNTLHRPARLLQL